MKILYLADECRAAELGLHGLHGIAPNVTVTWARTVPSALRWIRDNVDVARIFVEPGLDGQSGTSFVEHVRRLGLATPVVVVLPERPAVSPPKGPAVPPPERPAVPLPEPPAVPPSVKAGPSQPTRDARICVALQQGLLDLEAALRKAEQRRATEAAVAAEHLARREAELGAALAEAVAARSAIEHALSAAAAAHRHAEQCAADDRAAAAARQAALESRLAHEATARLDADHWYATELEALATRLADVQAQHDAALSEHSATRLALEQQLADTASALEQARKQRASEAAAAAANARLEADRHAAERTRFERQLADVQAQHDAALTEQAVARAALEEQLADADAALDQARQDRASEAAAGAEQQAALERQLAEEAAVRTTLEQNLAAAADARLDADERHAAERAQLERRLADVEAQHGAVLAEHAGVRAGLERQLADMAAALAQARQERASEADAAAERVAELVDRLGQESEMRTTAARDLAESRMLSERTRRRSGELARAFRRRTREQRARLETQLHAERADWARTLGARADEIRRLQLERETLQHRLATTRQELHRLHAIEERLQGSERARSAIESDHRRLSGEYDQVRQSLEQVRSAYTSLERAAGEHAAERARLEGLVADRDGQLSAQAARHLAAAQSAQEALTQTREKLRLALEAGSSETARLQREINVLRETLDATRIRAEALRTDAERVPLLQTELEDSEKEKRRQFERAPYGLCHCTREGVITRVNHSLLKLLGYRRADDLRRAGFASAFECADDLRWLIERSVSTQKTESAEATWVTRNRRRLVVRLQALATDDGTVEIVVEDMTNLRALEHRLRHAQRMEAVGRLAAEVAGTCDTLLHDVTREGRKWLAGIPIDSVQRQGELLLSEVTRAASSLQRLAEYGNKEMSALGPVSIQQVLRDLEPVLKRIVGDHIELVLPETSASVDVDVDADRVERVLINAASYARDRMHHGGQLRIQVATTVIGRRFLARYPNVRPGAHVLITVSELQKDVRPDVAAELRRDDEAANRLASDKPGVDLGALLGLIGNCGGHLWMEAEPAGNMTLKIHIPKHAGAEATESAVPAPRPDRSRPLTRWFRTDSTAATAGS